MELKMKPKTMKQAGLGALKGWIKAARDFPKGRLDLNDEYLKIDIEQTLNSLTEKQLRVTLAIVAAVYHQGHMQSAAQQKGFRKDEAQDLLQLLNSGKTAEMKAVLTKRVSHG